MRQPGKPEADYQGWWLMVSQLSKGLNPPLCTHTCTEGHPRIHTLHSLETAKSILLSPFLCGCVSVWISGWVGVIGWEKEQFVLLCAWVCVFRFFFSYFSKFCVRDGLKSHNNDRAAAWNTFLRSSNSLPVEYDRNVIVKHGIRIHTKITHALWQRFRQH